MSNWRAIYCECGRDDHQQCRSFPIEEQKDWDLLDKKRFEQLGLRGLSAEVSQVYIRYADCPDEEGTVVETSGRFVLVDARDARKKSAELFFVAAALLLAVSLLFVLAR